MNAEGYRGAAATAHALLAGAVNDLQFDALGLLGAAVQDVPDADQGLYLAEVAARATALHAGTWRVALAAGAMTKPELEEILRSTGVKRASRPTDTDDNTED